MQIGMIGLGRMGAGMTRRLVRAGHVCVVTDRSPESVDTLAREGAIPSRSYADLASKLARPRAVWLMIPAAAVDRALEELLGLLDDGDVVIDGGNSYYRDDIDRAERLRARGIHYVDCGDERRGLRARARYCLMIGGEPETVARLDPVFGRSPPAPGRFLERPAASEGPAPRSSAISIAVPTGRDTS